MTITPREWNYETGVSTLLGSARSIFWSPRQEPRRSSSRRGVLSLSGFFSEDQIQLQGEWSGPLPEGIVSRSFLLQGLPLSLDSFKGTIREFVLLDGEEKPAIACENILLNAWTEPLEKRSNGIRRRVF